MFISTPAFAELPRKLLLIKNSECNPSGDEENALDLLAIEEPGSWLANCLWFGVT
jgi:hypothetical protein